MKSIFPFLAAIALFLVITILYLSPLLEGKKLWQSDIAQHLGASKEIADFRAETGQEPLWTNSMFGGMPAYQVSAVYKGNLLGILDTIITLGLPHPANLIFLYLIGFFFLLMVMKVDPWLSIAGAIAFAFSSFFLIIIAVGHNSQAHAIGYMAPVIAGLILTFRRHYLWGGLITALFLSLEVKTNHPQITYYLAMIALLLGTFKLIHAIRFREVIPFLKSSGVLIIALLFAIATNITTLWATWEYGKYSIRGKSELRPELPGLKNGLDKSYITQYSYGIPETMTLLIPAFRGGASVGPLSEKSEVISAMRANGIQESTIRGFIDKPVGYNYWGDQFSTAGPVYVGAIVCFLFMLGTIIVRGPVRMWLVTATILSIMLAWGHNFMPFTDFFIQWVPGYNKFRAVTMTLVIAEFAMPLLGIIAVKVFFEKLADPQTRSDPKTRPDSKKLFRPLLIAYAITGAITLFFALFPGALLDFTGPNDASMARQLPEWFIQAIRDDRRHLLQADALRGFVFITLSAITLTGVLYGKLKREHAALLLILFFLVDMIPVNRRHLNNEGFTSPVKAAQPFEPTKADEQILLDKDPDFRVFNLTVDPFSDASTSYFHKSIGGYSGVKMRRYQDMIEHHIGKRNMDVLNMLNTKYFIVPDANGVPVARYNPGALGHAWFVEAYQLAGNAREEIKALEVFKPDSVAVVDKQFAAELAGLKPGADTADRIWQERYAPNRLLYGYTAKERRLALFSEIYYPEGWNSYVDEKPYPHFRADYLLRAMVLPAGYHKVEFRFEPIVYSVGERISRISSFVLILLILAGTLIEIRRRI